MSGQTANRIIGGGQVAGGLALSAMGMPEIGIPMMVGGGTSAATGGMGGNIAGGAGGLGGSLGMFGGPNQLSQFLGGTGNAPVTGMEGPPTAPTSGLFGLSSLMGGSGSGGGGMGGALGGLQGASLLKGLLPQGQQSASLPTPAPIQHMAPQSAQSPIAMPTMSPPQVPQVPRFV